MSTTAVAAIDSAERLLWAVSFAKRPALACSRACSKVGYLARTKDRGVLHYLESALNEQKHGMMYQLGDARASEHFAARDSYMSSFKRAVQRAAYGS